MNFLPVPEIPVLLLEQNQSTGSVLASWHPRCVQMHQSQERESFRSLANRMLRQNGSQSYGFVAKLPSDGGLCVGREIALGEQQVEDPTYGRESRCKLHFARPVG